MSFAQKITSIKGMEARRMPRLGKIRLGLKVKNKNAKPCDCVNGCFKCTHPFETPYFVVPTEVARYCGKEPAELDIIVPLEDLETVFPRSYKWYGSSRGLKCSGNLEKAYRLDEKTLQRVEIPVSLQHERQGMQSLRISPGDPPQGQFWGSVPDNDRILEFHDRHRERPGVREMPPGAVLHGPPEAPESAH